MKINPSTPENLRLEKDQSTLQMNAVNQLVESGAISQDLGGMYPALDAVWQANQREIDRQIETYYMTASQEDPRSSIMLSSNLHNWLNELEMDNFARQELYLLTRGDDFLGLVETRVGQLREDGRLDRPAFLSQGAV
jgi:hypothetical protein